MYQRKFSSKTSELRTMSGGSLVIMFMSHHVDHIIMSTTHQQVVGKCDSSEACEVTGENTLGRETLCFFG